MSSTMQRQALFAALLLSILAIIPAPVAFSQDPPALQTQEQQSAQRKPIPRSWKIGIAAAVAVLIAVALAFSARAWRAGNLFDREYRFPPVPSAALRLGANKCGGCMATISFRDRGDPTGETS